MPLAHQQADTSRSLRAIAARLVALRHAYGMAQGEFAAAAGIAHNTYNQYEKAKGRPELDKAVMIRDRFGVTLDWIYFGETSGLSVQIADLLRRSS